MNKKKLITFSSKHLEKMEFIQKQEGHLSLSSVVHAAIIYYYEKKFYSKYAPGSGVRVKEKEMTDAEICTERHGGVVEDRNGNDVCIISAGSEGQIKRTVPLGMMQTWKP